MSVLQVYLSWANSVLCEVNRTVDNNVCVIQDGALLCQIIDVLAPESSLEDTAKASVPGGGVGRQRAYIHCALDHMKNHGVKIVFSTQDIMDGDIKSLLDVMWLLILNYGIHFIGDNSFQRTVGVGKKALLDWCQGELDVTFDPKDTLATSLCTGSYFTKLLQIFAGSHIEETEDKVAHLHKLLQEIEERYGIRRTIISPNDLVDGTVDEHTLMIYLSLLRRRVCSTVRSARREMLSVEGKEAALARVEERNRSLLEEVENRRRYSEQAAKHNNFLQQQQHQHYQQQQQEEEGGGEEGEQERHQQHEQQYEQQQYEQYRSSRVLSLDSSLAMPREALQAKSQESLESSKNWWLSSDSNSQLSGQDGRSGTGEGRKNSLVREAEQVLLQTISEKVQEHVQHASSDNDDDDDDKDTDNSHGERETESLSEQSSGAFDEGYGTLKTDPSQLQTRLEDPQGSTQSKSGRSKSADAKSTKADAKMEKSVQIKISRPKDYFLQWEETIDRLSQGPSSAPDVSDMFPRSPRQILRGIPNYRSARSCSESDDQEVRGESVWKRREYFENRSISPFGDSRGLNRLSRSTSTPTRSAHAIYSTYSNSQDRLSRSFDSRGRTKSSGVVEDRRSRGEGGRNSADRGMNSQGGAEAPGGGDFRSSFMETLDELQRSGKAKRVILPELGPDTPVVMVPAEGRDVLLLFDALKQVRLDVDSSVTLGGGNTNGNTHRITNSTTHTITNSTSRRTTNGTTNTAAKGSSRSPARTSHSEQDTEAKVVRHKEASAVSGASPGREEGEDTVSSLPRPTAHKHRVPKPLDIRVSDLRTGRPHDGRRTQSATERMTVSSLAGASRYRSLSPRRPQDGTSPSERGESGPASLGDRSHASSRAVSLERSEDLHVEHVPGIGTVSADTSHGFRPTPQRSSPYTSPYRAAEHRLPGSRSLSPYRSTSPRHGPGVGRIWERPPPLEPPEDLVSPRPRVGGQGRVPRREAWERQRKRREVQSLVSSGSNNVGGGGVGGVESSAQARFIQVLYKEIEELKQKIEVMEDSQAESSPERGSPKRGWKTTTTTTATAPTSTAMTTGKDSLFTTHSEIRETDNRMVLARRSMSPRLSPRPSSWQSPRPWEGSTLSPHRPSPRLQQASLSPRRAYTPTATLTTTLKAHQSLSPRRRSADDLSPIPRSIQLGYKSPIRSVTQEIWGRDLMGDADTETPHSERREHYRKLISKSAVSEVEVIELKQALASAVVENDILQAKLRNARYDIEEKLSKTNEVLDDCRQHLARSQAENMELRTALERERDRAETNEVYAQDLRQMVQQVREDNRELEEELEHTSSMLDQSGPGLEVLQQQNDTLRGKAAHVHHQNSSLKREMEELRQSHSKSVNTIRELRNLLEEVREERSTLQHQVRTMQQQQQRAQQQAANSEVRSGLSHYGQEKGARDEAEPEHLPVSAAGGSFSEKVQSSYTPPPPRSASFAGDSTSTRSLSAGTPRVSGIHPRSVSPPRGLSYRYEGLSPVVPSTYREIYPHRKPRYQSDWDPYDRSPERLDSPVTFIDYPDLQRFPTKLDPPFTTSTRDPRPSYTTTTPPPPSSRDSSPIYKPVPYKPYASSSSSFATTASTSFPTLLSERVTTNSAHETRARSSPLTRGTRSPNNRTSPNIGGGGGGGKGAVGMMMGDGFRSASSSPRGFPRERLSPHLHHHHPHHHTHHGVDSVLYRTPRSASCSPGRSEDGNGNFGRRGILKRAAGSSNNSSSRERTPSPRYASRSHSPPTRLSPEQGLGLGSGSGGGGGGDGDGGGKTMTKRKKKTLSFRTSESGSESWGGQPGRVTALGEEMMRQRHSSTSWLHLQLAPTDSRTGLPSDVTHPGMFSRDEHLLLSDDQRRYANSLIRKYTGINA